MKLENLNPKWVTDAWGHHSDAKFGITFKCPHCSKRLGVMFKNPIGETNQDALWAIPIASLKWDRKGETFESLSLSPSIDVKGHWHGYIRNGQVENTTLDAAENSDD